MTETAPCMTCEVVDISSWKATRLVADKRIDSDRLIDRGKSCLIQIPQAIGTTPDKLNTRVFRRYVTVLKPLYPNDQNTAESIAFHASKAFSMLLEDPERYYAFFDFVVYKGKEILKMALSANGCLLTAALYRTPPWEVFEPNLFEFYARWSSRLYGALYDNRFRSNAIKLLSDERHMKKAVEATANLFMHPSKI